jgi:hypothetical protein
MQEVGMDTPLEPGRDGSARSHWPLRSEPDEVMAARQLADACIEARTDADRQYAIAEAATFLTTLGGQADSRALIALLRLPADADSEELLADVEQRLADRAPAVVGSLLRVVVEGDHPACDNAAEALDKALVVDLAQGLIEVIEDDRHDGLRRAAAAGLISLGPDASDQLAAALDDPEDRYWVTEAAGCPPDATWDELMEAIAAADDEDVEARAYGEDVVGRPQAEHSVRAAGDSRGDEDDMGDADMGDGDMGDAKAVTRGEAVGNDAADARVEEALGEADAGSFAHAGYDSAAGYDANAGYGAKEERLDDVVDEAADEEVDEAADEQGDATDVEGDQAGGSDPADGGDPGADLERDFAAFEEDFRAFDRGLKRRPPAN